MDVFDSVHGQIFICPKAKEIIDTKEFQRLRNIKQLGAIYQVFTGASHNRFEHSIGVYYLARSYMDILNKYFQYFSDKEYELISIGALIHDIGHGPFSHLFDEFIKINEHEYRSIGLFKYMNSKYNFGYTSLELDFIYNVIYPKNIVNDKKYLYQIVSNSNGIDVDRMDYIIRDTKMTGLNYGIEYHRIMNNTIIYENELQYDIKCKTAIEAFFATRYILYKEICNHRTVISIENHIKEILTEIDEVFGITKCIKEDDWEKFILLTDNIIYSIQFMEDDRLLKAKEILNDMYDRKIYKLVGEIVSDSKLDIESPNKNIIIDHKKITYHSLELPKYINTNRYHNINDNLQVHKDEYITKILCKDKNNIEANELLKIFSINLRLRND